MPHFSPFPGWTPEEIIEYVAETEERGYPEVDTKDDLPSASEHIGGTYLVTTATGTWPFNKKRAGLYRSDGIIWKRMGIAPSASDLNAVVSATPGGCYKVISIHYDSENEEHVIIRSDTIE